MKSGVDELLEKLDNGIVLDNDAEFLECLMDLDDRLKELEKKE